MDTISYQDFMALFSDKAYKEDIPINGSFELTPFCNFDCKMCYVHIKNHESKNTVLTGSQWIDIIKEAIEMGMLNTVLTGGEAMTHPDFWSIYMYLINQGIHIRIKTNGLLLTKESIERFITYPPFMIDVSLYGCDSKSYLAVTGVDAYQKVVDNIHSAIMANLQLRIMITPSIFMKPWVKQIMELAKTFDLPVVVNDILIEPNDNTGRSKVNFELNERESCEIQQLKKELFPTISIEKEIRNIENRIHVSDKGLYCNGGRIAFAVNWDGKMKPCLCFPRNIICAHPLEYGFRKAWEKVNSEIKNFSIPQTCHSCNINTKCHYCPVQHGNISSKGSCNPTICSYWHRVYNE